MSADSSNTTFRRRIAEGLTRAARSGVEQARRYWRLALLGALVVIFVLGPGYTATQSDCYARFEDLGAYHQTWTESTHANVTCQSCHVRPSAVAQTTYAVRMVGEIYVSLLPLDREPQTLGRPTNDACDECHVDLRSVSPAGDLLIPHTAHVDALGIDCITCHVGELVHNDDPSVSTTPRMATCLTCHDGEVAKENCDACHTEKATPESHQDPQFIVSHADLRDEIDCESCHAWRDEWCLDCHARRPRSHGSGVDPSEWRKEHREVVYAREQRNCEACHEAPFCTECHGEVPARNLDPTLTLAR